MTPIIHDPRHPRPLLSCGTTAAIKRPPDTHDHPQKAPELPKLDLTYPYPLNRPCSVRSDQGPVK